ncbi:MAG TPA: hypothetical protein ENN60_03520 [archaeon]|nr:hypothetical protein [archaeon]
MELPGFQMHSFPMKPNVFYAFRDFSFKSRNFERPIVIATELLIEEAPDKVLVRQGSATTPDFLMVSRPYDGFMKATLKSAESIIRDVLFSMPVGDSISGAGKTVADLAAIFSAMPLPEGNLAMRLPVILTTGMEYEKQMGHSYSLETAIFELKPQKFGFVVTTRDGLKKLVSDMEIKLEAGFSGLDGKD